MNEVVKIDWKKRVEESGGQSSFVPEALKADVEKWHESRMAFQKKVNDLAKEEVNLNVMFQNLILKIREYFAENGHNDIWTADVGFDTNALRDGEFVINITENNKG